MKPFMQNKPNFKKTKMNLNSCLTKDYRNASPLQPRENKPDQSQLHTRPIPRLFNRFCWMGGLKKDTVFMLACLGNESNGMLLNCGKLFLKSPSGRILTKRFQEKDLERF
jgi:hypothetical protein